MPSRIDNMTSLINTIDSHQLASAWDLSANAVRSRLRGERDLTMSEIGAVADLVGMDLFLHALRGSFH